VPTPQVRRGSAQRRVLYRLVLLSLVPTTNDSMIAGLFSTCLPASSDDEYRRSVSEFPRFPNGLSIRHRKPHGERVYNSRNARYPHTVSREGERSFADLMLLCERSRDDDAVASIWTLARRSSFLSNLLWFRSLLRCFCSDEQNPKRQRE
jgi:hypothetical protein